MAARLGEGAGEAEAGVKAVGIQAQGGLVRRHGLCVAARVAERLAESEAGVKAVRIQPCRLAHGVDRLAVPAKP